MTGKILVIDDDVISRNMLISTLTKAGYSIIVAPDGDLGIKTASSILPDVIILDIMMPGKSGLEVATILKNDPKTEKIPIIFLSSIIAEKGNRTKGKRDATSYLSKPYKKDELLNEVKKYILGMN